MNKDKYFITNFVFILIIISPIFSNYVFFSFFSIGDFLLFLTIPWVLSNLYINHTRLVYLLLIFLIITISFIHLGNFNVYRGFYRSSYYFILIFTVVNIKIKSYQIFLDYYIKICSFISFLLIFQRLIYSVSGIKYSLHLPLPVYEKDVLLVLDHIYRSGGVFSEPSYFAIFLFPALFISIQKNIFLYFLFIVAAVISTSALAFFSIIASLIFYFIKRFGFFYSIFPIVIIVLTIFSIIFAELLQYLMMVEPWLVVLIQLLTFSQLQILFYQILLRMNSICHKMTGSILV